MKIEEQILNEIAPVSVNRTEVLGWLETERTRLNRKSAFTFAGVALVFACALGLVYHLLESEANQAKQLVGTYPSSHTLMLAELTHELCGEKPAKYWTHQISLIGSQKSLNNF